MVIRPEEQNNPYKLNLDGVPFRGEFEVKRLSASDMTVINVLPLQEYLYGVVPGEIESYSHIEALKAQAVAARTYTVNNMNKYKENGFNLCNTTWSQVYKGYSAETESTNRAVDETKGQIVLYNDKPAQVFYFSSSGGQTEDVKNVWGSDFPYLSSVEDKYESGKSWNYNWTKTLTAEEIKKRLISKGKDVGEVTGIDILKTSGAGRPVELVISGTKSQAVFKNAATRDIFGLPSQMYTIESSSGKDNSISIRSATSEVSAKPLGELNVMSASGEMVLDAGKGLSVAGRDGKTITVSSQSSDSYTFSGRGWGHAIGMSQEGAKGMANEGFTYDEILTHYFQGTEVK